MAARAASPQAELLFRYGSSDREHLGSHVNGDSQERPSCPALQNSRHKAEGRRGAQLDGASGKRSSQSSALPAVGADRECSAISWCGVTNQQHQSNEAMSSPSPPIEIFTHVDYHVFHFVSSSSVNPNPSAFSIQTTLSLSIA